MATYCAVVKYRLNASLDEKRRALLEGLGMIAMELVDEHDFDLERIERAFEGAQAEAELELEMKTKREEDR